MEKNDETLAGNYTKLWLMERVNIPFAFSVSLIQERWKLPLTGKNACQRFFIKLHADDKKFLQTQRFQDVAVAINAIAALKQPKAKAKKAVQEIITDLPTQGFSDDVQNLAREFNFEDMWIPHLAVYLITGKVSAPDGKLSANIPPPSALQQYKIFTLVAKKKAQHSFLKFLHGIPATQEQDNPNRESIATIDAETKYLPSRLIHGSSDIADIVFGEIDEERLSDAELSKEEKRRVDKIDQYRKRFQKYCVPLTKKEYGRLLRIFSK